MDNSTKTLEMKEASENVQECMNEELNDDCILHIFKYLKIFDLIKIETVCKKWKKLSQQSWPVIEKFDANDLPRWRFHNIDCLTIKDEQFGEMIRRIGKDLKYLNLKGFHKLSFRSLPSIIETCSNLQSLNLGNVLEFQCQCDFEFRCPRCVKLRMRAGTMLNSWTTFNQLTELSISTNMEEPELENLFLNMKKLETLEILYKQYRYFPLSLPTKLPFNTLKEIILLCETDTEEMLEPLMPVLKRFHDLHTVVFYNLKNLDVISEVLIPNAATLKTLCLDFECVVDYITTDHLKFMGLLNLVNLERLLLQYADYVNDEFLEQLAKKCKKLVYVNLSVCSNVTEIGISYLSKLPALKYLLKNDVSLKDPVEKSQSLFVIEDYFPMLVQPKQV